MKKQILIAAVQRRLSKVLNFGKSFLPALSLLLTACCLLPTLSSALSYTVTNTADAGAGSLRAAITSANGAGADNIIFAIGTATITLASALPALTDNNTTIDGGGTANTELTLGLNGTLAVTINGGSISTITAGMTISSDNNIIKGLNFINVGTTGTTDVMIYITPGADNNQILGCYIGTDVTGTASAGANTEYGIWIADGANNVIGGTAADRNLISGLKTTGRGIYIQSSPAPGNTVKGNIVGLQKDGVTYLATTQQYGVYLNDGGNTIGGTAAGEGNVISGNTNSGIYQSSGVNSILGNIIGPQADGTSNVASNVQSYGVFNYAPSIIIGGSAAGARNIISANTNSGVYILSAWSGGIIKGNYIGLDITGTALIAGSSQDYGVYIASTSYGGIIGGTAAGEGNVISGNNDGIGTGKGIYLASSGAFGAKSVVLGNIIGPQADGTSYVAFNAQSYGIYISGSPNNIIGGSADGAGNIISANETYGVYMTAAGSTGNTVKGNFIGPSSATVSETFKIT